MTKKTVLTALSLGIAAFSLLIEIAPSATAQESTAQEASAQEATANAPVTQSHLPEQTQLPSQSQDQLTSQFQNQAPSFPNASSSLGLLMGGVFGLVQDLLSGANISAVSNSQISQNSQNSQNNLNSQSQNNATGQAASVLDGVTVKAPFVSVDTRGGVKVKAPFVMIDTTSGAQGVRVRAPF